MHIIPLTSIVIDDIVTALEAGKVIVYPTETCYGIGCDPTNQEAVNRIFELKGREKNKPLLMVASDMETMLQYVDWSPKLLQLAEKHWPGALTAVVEAKQPTKLVDGVLAPDGTVAFRITSHPLASEVSFVFGKPIVSTSANRAGEKSLYNSADVIALFSSLEIQPDIFIDAGDLPERAPSTVVRVEGEHVTVLRQGDVDVR